jgi:tRNA (guanine37-N1)-methyltransferase
MMHINYVTGFPDFFSSPLNTSMLKKAQKKSLFSYEIFDLKNYTLNKHMVIDDTPFAGKPGMLLKPEPFFRAMDHILESYGDHPIIFMGPEGKKLDQDIAKSFVNFETITFLCGHFKGIDQRVIDRYVTDRISIGDFIITGGELASLVMTDTVVRLIPGVLNDLGSATSDSFEDGLLDSDYYTRPETYREQSVPKVLLGGNHKEIEKWKLENKLLKTKEFREDLYKEYKKNRKE